MCLRRSGIYICICGFTASVRKWVSCFEIKKSVSFAQKAASWRHSDWYISNKLNPALKYAGMPIQHHFRNRTSSFCDGNCFAVTDGRWHHDSVSKISQQKCIHCIKCIPICLFEVKWSMQSGLPPNNWLLQSTIQYSSSENLPTANHLWPTKHWSVIWDSLTISWLL